MVLETIKAALKSKLLVFKSLERLEASAHVGCAFGHENLQAMLHDVGSQSKGLCVERTDHLETVERIKEGLCWLRLLLLLCGTLPAEPLCLRRRACTNVLVVNVKEERHSTHSHLGVWSKGDLANNHMISVLVRLARGKRKLDYFHTLGRFNQAKASLLDDHAELVTDNVLWTKLVVPVLVSAKLQSNLELEDGVQGSTETAFVDPAAFGVLDVADELVEVRKRVLVDAELVPKRRAIVDLVRALLVKRFDVDVGSNRVALRFCVRQPRWARTSNARIMNVGATLAKWTVNVEIDESLL